MHMTVHESECFIDGQSMYTPNVRVLPLHAILFLSTLCYSVQSQTTAGFALGRENSVMQPN